MSSQLEEASYARGVYTAPDFLPEAVPPSNRPEARRLTLVAYAVGFLLAVLSFGLDPVLGFAAGVLNFVFLMFFARHMTFSIAAARWVDADVAAPDVDLWGYCPPVLVVVAAHNERAVIDGLARSLLNLRYPPSRLRLMIVDDASTDGTGERLDQWQAAYPQLEVLHRSPGSGGGKSGALNYGIETAGDFPTIVIVFDADHEPAPSSLLRVVRHFRDPKVGAVMGRCVVRNASETKIATTVFVDYLSGYLVNEYGRQAVYELPAYGGANCAVRASVLRHIGGFNPASVTEDTDLTLRIIAGGGKVRYDPAAVDFEEAASTAAVFWKQRYRWARGHQKCARDYWRPLLFSKHLSLGSKFETLSFLLVYHSPVWVALGVLLTVLRAFGIGDAPVAIFLPLGMLLFVGPLVELTVGLMAGRVERITAWSMLLFLPMFVMTVGVVTWAYIGGMLGLPYSWKKTKRTGGTSTHEVHEDHDDEQLPPLTVSTPNHAVQDMVIRTGGRIRIVR